MQDLHQIGATYRADVADAYNDAVDEEAATRADNLLADPVALAELIRDDAWLNEMVHMALVARIRPQVVAEWDSSCSTED